MRSLVVVLQVLVLAGGASAAEPPCGTVVAKANGRRLDLAPPTGFVEVCARDKALCAMLTSGYPATVITLGYFVRAGEWEARKKSGSGFHNYLIAQASESTKPAMIEELKSYLRSQGGAIPDHTDLPSTLLRRGRVNLGIVDESSDSITTGVLLKTRAAAPPMSDINQVALNSAVVVGPTALSLYLFQDFRTDRDVAKTKQQAKQWLQCLRAAN